MLFLRIALAVAILAAAAATTIVWVQVKPNVESIIAKRNGFGGTAGVREVTRRDKAKVRNPRYCFPTSPVLVGDSHHSTNNEQDEWGG